MLLFNLFSLLLPSSPSLNQADATALHSNQIKRPAQSIQPDGQDLQQVINISQGY